MNGHIKHIILDMFCYKMNAPGELKANSSYYDISANSSYRLPLDLDA